MKKYEREDKIIDRLERENRELKNHIRGLTASIRKLNKGYNKFLFEDKEKEAVVSAKKIAKKICYVCHVGSMEKVSLGNRYFRKCTNEGCENRTKTKEEK